eukprot:1471232-Rhodomonas_salina.1
MRGFAGAGGMGSEEVRQERDPEPQRRRRTAPHRAPSQGLSLRAAAVFGGTAAVYGDATAVYGGIAAVYGDAAAVYSVPS